MEEFDEFYRATSRRLLPYAYALTADLGAALGDPDGGPWQNWPGLAAS